MMQSYLKYRLQAMTPMEKEQFLGEVLGVLGEEDLAHVIEFALKERNRRRATLPPVEGHFLDRIFEGGGSL